VITAAELPRCADGLLWDTPSIAPLQPALVAREPLHQKIGEDFDPLRGKSASVRPSGPLRVNNGDAMMPALTLDEITGGSPYGATTIARYQGRKIAETAKKLHG
jgi:hypothetical protein